MRLNLIHKHLYISKLYPYLKKRIRPYQMIILRCFTIVNPLIGLQVLVEASILLQTRDIRLKRTKVSSKKLNLAI